MRVLLVHPSPLMYSELYLRLENEELVRTQAVINRKHLGWRAIRKAGAAAGRLLLRGQTNFLRMLWNFGSVYNSNRQYADHFKPVRYEMRPPRALVGSKPSKAELYVHVPAPAQRPARA